MLTEFKLPELGENIHSGTVTRVMVSAGQTIKKEQSVVEVETDKAAIEVPCSVGGTIKELKVKAGDKVAPGQVILTVETESAAKPAAKEPAPSSGPQHAPQPAAKEPPKSAAPPAKAPLATETGLGEAYAPPAARRFAREIGVDISHVRGTGPNGSITIDDVKAYSQSQRAVRGASVEPSGHAPALPDFSQWGPIEREAMSSVRRATADHMSAAWSQVPHVTQYDRADITDFEELRKKHSGKVKLTVTALAIKIVAAALRHFPKFNASVDAARGEIIHKKYCHIGVAVDTERGLLVPVIRDADKKSILELSVELASLAEKARAKKLSPAEMQGGTFTITNLGGIGGVGFSPIVNWPEVAILGIARSSVEPLSRDGGFVPRLMLPLSLSYDHRLIDGADGARFLRWVAEAFEKPLLLAFEGMI